MNRRVLIFVLIASILGVSPVAGAQGTLYTANLAELGPQLSDEALGGMRGGLAGVAFSVFFTTHVTSQADFGATFAVQPSTGAGSGAPPVDPSTISNNQNGQVRIATIAGSNFQGASGLFVLTQVPGSNNVVLTSVNIQIAIINVPNTAAIPSLATLFR
jgi:hypothetical protein